MYKRILMLTLAGCLSAVSAAEGQTKPAQGDTARCVDANPIGICRKWVLITPKSKGGTSGEVSTKRKAPPPPNHEDTTKTQVQKVVGDSAKTNVADQLPPETKVVESPALTPTTTPKKKDVLDTSFATCALHRQSYAARIGGLKTGGGNCQLTLSPDSILAAWRDAYPDLELEGKIQLRKHIMNDLSEVTCPQRPVAMAYMLNGQVALRGWSRTLGDSLHPNETCGFNRERNRYEVTFGSGNVILNLPGTFADVATFTPKEPSPAPPSSVVVTNQMTTPSSGVNTPRIVHDTLWMDRRVGTPFVKKAFIISSILGGACGAYMLIEKSKYCGSFKFHLHW